jgi:hypothetical protein
MKRRFLGIPVPIIAIGLAILLIGGAALAAFLWQKQVPSTVKIIGAEVEAYQDEACTIPLTALDFGEMRAGETTDPVSFYLKNIGDDPVYCALAENNLDALLALFEGDGNVVPADPDRLALPTDEDITPGYWQETATTTTLNGNPDATDTHFGVTDTTSFPDSGVVKIDNELIYYAVKTSDQFEGCIRGYADTTATAHSMGATITLMEWVEETSEILYDLQPDEVLSVSLYIESDPAITRSDKPFTLIIEAKDTAY